MYINFCIVLLLVLIVSCIIFIIHLNSVYGDIGFLSLIFTWIGIIISGIITIIVCSLVEFCIINIGHPQIEHKVEIIPIYSIENNSENFILGTYPSNGKIHHTYLTKNEDGSYKAETTTANKIILDDKVVPQLKIEWDEYVNKNLRFWMLNWQQNREEKFILPHNTIYESSVKGVNNE